MPERLKAILDKITAWWKKFNTKQRSVLISIDASSTGKELFINGIGKNGDELISLFEIGSIVSDKDAN